MNGNSINLVLPLRKYDDVDGWPWQHTASSFPIKMKNGDEWPKITIVTPSYNQGQFLEETIRSVLCQNYPNLEYLVLDGGSTDESKQIIEHYEPYLTYWRSEKDAGQSAALIEGFERSTGTILGWLNSDDLLLPDSLRRVAEFASQHPNADCFVGGSIVIDEFGQLMNDRMGLPRILRGGRRTKEHLLLVDCGFYQPGSFWRSAAYDIVGGLNPSFRFTMDYDLYLKLADRKPLQHLDHLLACFRFHGESKTTQLADVMQEESEILWAKYDKRSYSMFSRVIYPILQNVWNRITNFPLRIGVKLNLVKLPYPDNN